jgi:PAS domain-containing protein
LPNPSTAHHRRSAPGQRLVWPRYDRPGATGRSLAAGAPAHRPHPTLGLSGHAAQSIHGPWKASEIDLVETVADQLTIAIQQAQTLSQAQRELQERQRAEARLKEAQRMAHTGSWEFDLPTERITWSEEMFRIYGLPPDQSPLSLEAQLAVLAPPDNSDLATADLIGPGQGAHHQCRRHHSTPRRAKSRVVHLLGQAQRDAKRGKW